MLGPRNVQKGTIGVGVDVDEPGCEGLSGQVDLQSPSVRDPADQLDSVPHHGHVGFDPRSPRAVENRGSSKHQIRRSPPMEALNPRQGCEAQGRTCPEKTSPVHLVHPPAPGSAMGPEKIERPPSLRRATYAPRLQATPLEDLRLQTVSLLLEEIQNGIHSVSNRLILLGGEILSLGMPDGPFQGSSSRTPFSTARRSRFRALRPSFSAESKGLSLPAGGV